jgi:hypothetical protein
MADPIAHCPGHPGILCARDVEWGHPCDRDESGVYECEEFPDA